MLPIIVASPRFDCPAVLSIKAEGWPLRFGLMTTDTSYSRFLVNAWKRGGFINIEWDIAPWAGALEELSNCPEYWCSFTFPFARTRDPVMGCVKFSQKLVEKFPDLWKGWENRSWRNLDAFVLGDIKKALGQLQDHRHQPMVAHVKNATA